MIDYIDLLLGEQLERQEREETGGTWNGETVRVPVPQPEDGEEVLTADSRKRDRHRRKGRARKRRS